MISKKDVPLISVIVLTYLQRHYLEECLDSIFQQTYPNIELVVCDDCSADFDVDEVLVYINEHKSENISNVVVFRQPKNVGIVQNAQTGVSLSSGEFFKLHAGDDMFYVDTALEKIAGIFQNAGADAVAARSRACQPDGTMAEEPYPSQEGWNCVINADAQTQFNLLATQGLQVYFHEPALFWRRRLFDEIGGFDTDFRLVTDWPVLLKATGTGHRITTADNTVMLCRYGGIMNKNPSANMDFRKAYYLECISVLRKYGLQRFEAEGLRKKVLRCRQAISCLENRIVMEDGWGNWPLGRQFLWRIKNLRFLFVSWLYRLRYRQPTISHAKTSLLVMAVCMAMYIFDIQLLSWDSSAFLWSVLFFAAALWLLAQVAGVFCIRILKLILNTRGRRR